MKLIYLFAAVVLFSVVSCTLKTKPECKIVLGDTIKTPNGLQYYYTKIGEGRRIEAGSEVGTCLSLMVKDSVVWNTDELPDSLFTFIAGYTRLITGFTEAYWLLREGDEIVAILPDSLAYGAKGAGDIIPPYATLIYDKFKVVKVGEPKGVLCDTLLNTLENRGVGKMIAEYNRIMSTNDSVNYHIEKDQLYGLCNKLNRAGEYQQAADVASKLAIVTGDNQFRYIMVVSYEKAEQYKQAKDSLELIIISEPENQQMKDKLAELNEKILEKKSK